MSKIVPLNDINAVAYMPHEDWHTFLELTSQVAPKEVQWFCTIERHVHEDPGSEAAAVRTSKYRPPSTNYYYEIKGCFLPPQTVSGAECDTDDMQMYMLMQDFKNKHRLIDTETGEDLGPDIEKVNSIVCQMHAWCHTHPFNGSKRSDYSYNKPSPSGQDERNFRQWVARNQKDGLDTPMAMIIFSLSDDPDDVFVRVFEPRLEGGAFFSDVKLRIGKPNYDFSWLEEEIKEKVTVQTYQSYGGTTYRGSHEGAYRGMGRPRLQGPTKPPNTALDRMRAREKAATKMFNKRYLEGDFSDLIAKINESADNLKEVKAIKATLDHWLKNAELWRAFLVGLCGKDEHLDELRTLDPNDDSMEYFEDDMKILAFLAEHWRTDLVSAGELQLTLTFAMKLERNRKKDGTRVDDIVNSFREARAGYVAEQVMAIHSIDTDDLNDLTLNDLVGDSHWDNLPGADDDTNGASSGYNPARTI